MKVASYDENEEVRHFDTKEYRVTDVGCQILCCVTW